MVNTFGKIRAGIRLRETLLEIKSDNPILGKKYNNKVESTVKDCYIIVKELSHISDLGIYDVIWSSCCKTCVKRLSNCNVPEIVKQHLNNTIVGIFRNARRNYYIKHKDTPKKTRARMNAVYDKHIIQYERALKESFIVGDNDEKKI